MSEGLEVLSDHSPSQLPVPSMLTGAEAKGRLSCTLASDLELSRACSGPLPQHRGCQQRGGGWEEAAALQPS